MGATTLVAGNSTERSTDCVMVKFEDPSKSWRVMREVRQTDNKCLCTKVLSIKQWVELKSTRACRDERARDGTKTRGIKELRFERVDTLSHTSLDALLESMQLLEGAEAQELLTLFLTQEQHLSLSSLDLTWWSQCWPYTLWL